MTSIQTTKYPIIIQRSTSAFYVEKPIINVQSSPIIKSPYVPVVPLKNLHIYVFKNGIWIKWNKSFGSNISSTWPIIIVTGILTTITIKDTEIIKKHDYIINAYFTFMQLDSYNFYHIRASEFGLNEYNNDSFNKFSDLIFEKAKNRDFFY